MSVSLNEPIYTKHNSVEMQMLKRNCAKQKQQNILKVLLNFNDCLIFMFYGCETLSQHTVLKISTIFDLRK